MTQAIIALQLTKHPSKEHVEAFTALRPATNSGTASGRVSIDGRCPLPVNRKTGKVSLT